MNTESSLDWCKHLETGERYLKTATNGLARKSVFNNTLIHQLTAMAVEHMLVAVYQYYRQMPTDHTLDGLVDGLSPYCSINPVLVKEIKSIGRYDDLCPLAPVNPWVPNDMEIQAILAIGRQVLGFAELQVNQSAPPTIRKNTKRIGLQ